MWRRKDTFKKVPLLVICELLILWQMCMATWCVLAYGANRNFFQTDWSGGADTVNGPVDPTNEGYPPVTPWAKYYAKDPNTDTTQAGKVMLSQLSSSVLQTTDTDFTGSGSNTGVFSNTDILNTGAPASVRLKAVTNDKLRTTLGQWGGPAFIPKGPGDGSAVCTTGADNLMYVLTGNQTQEFLSYNISTKKWTTLTSAPASIGPGCAMAYPGSGDFIYVLRGNYSYDFWKYSIQNNTWSSLYCNIPKQQGTPYPIGPGGAMAVYNATNIYVIFGNTTTYFYKYTIDSGNGVWSNLSTVYNTVGAGAKLIYHPGDAYLYCIRGGGNTQVYRYNITASPSNQWFPDWPGATVTLPYSVGADGSTFIDGNDGSFYITFGDVYMWEFYKFDPVTGVSTKVTNNLPFVPSDGTAAVYRAADNKIYYLPGYSNYRPSRMVSFDIATQRWSEFNGTGRPSYQAWAEIKAGNYIYSIPNTNANISVYYNRFYRFDLTTEQWTDIGYLPAGCSTSSPRSDQLMYYSGNPDNIYWMCNDGANKGVIYAWSIAGQTWTPKVSVSGMSADANLYYPGVGTLAYIVAGQGSNLVYSYDLTSDTTTPAALPAMPAALDSQHGCITYARPGATAYLFVFQGYYSGSHQLFRFNMTTQLWDAYTLPSGTYTTNSQTGSQSTLIWQGGASDNLFVLMAYSTYAYKVSVANPASCVSMNMPVNGYYCTQYYPGTGSFIYFVLNYDVAGGFYKYNMNTGAWTPLGERPFSCSYGWLCMPDPAGDTMYYMTQDFTYPVMFKYTLSTDTWTSPFMDIYYSQWGIGAGAYCCRYGDYIYALLGGGSKTFYRYNIALDRWEKRQDAPHLVTTGGYLLYPSFGGDYMYALCGGVSKKWMRYSISGDSWDLSGPNNNPAFPNLVAAASTGACMAGMLDVASAQCIWLLRGGANSTFQFSKYTVSSASWQNLNPPPHQAYYGTEMIFTGDTTNLYVLLCYNGQFKDFYQYAYKSDTSWTKVGDYPRLTGGFPHFTYDGSNYIYSLDNSQTPYLYRFNLTSLAWETTLTNAPLRTYHRGIISHGGPNYPDFLFMWRTSDQQSDAFDGFKYSISENKWDCPSFFNPTNASSDGRAPQSYATCVAATYKGTNYLYLSGQDYTGSGYTDIFWQLNLDTGVWTKKSLSPILIYGNNGGDMIYPGTGDYLYAMAGNTYTAFWRYSIPNDTWEIKAEPVAGFNDGARLTYYNGYIYATRGWNTNTFWKYNISSNQWLTENSTNLGNVSNGGALVCAGANMYCLSGNNTPNFYKAQIGSSWIAKSPIPCNVTYGATLVYPGVGNYLYCSTGSNVRKFFRYDISQDTWLELTAPCNEWSYGGKMVYANDGYFYLIKGLRNSEPYLRRYNVFASGDYTSPVLEIGPNAGFGAAAWTHTADGTTSLANVRIRTFNKFDKTDAPAWAEYSTSGADISGISAVKDTNKYLQYQTNFKTTDLATLPALNNITFNWGYYPHDAYLISSIYDSSFLRNRLMKLSWSEQLPVESDGVVHSDVRFQLKTSKDKTTWTDWYGPEGTTYMTNDFSNLSDYAKNSKVVLESGTARLAKDLEDFAYKQAVTVDNTAGTAKSNLVVTVSLTAQNAAFWAHAQSTSGTDIRVYDALNSQKIAYKLSAFNYANKTATINFRIPSLGVETRTFYLLYGSSTTVSESDDTVSDISMNGLVGWWRFNEGAGNTANDSSGNNNTGTLQNGPAWVEGKNQGGLRFNGSTQYVSANDSATLRLGNAGLTTAAWIYLDNRNSRMVVVGKMYTEYEMILEGSATGLNMFKSNGSSGNYENYQASYSFNTGQWYHVATVVNGNVMTHYVDGVAIGSQALSYSGTMGLTNPLNIACRSNGGGNYFSGIIDDVVVYNRPLSLVEINSLRTGGGSNFTGKVYIVAPETQVSTPATLVSQGWPTNSYREAIIVTNPGAVALTNHQVRVALDYTHTGFWSHVKNDGSDIRIVDADNSTILTYWLESFDYANKTAAVWAKVPSITASTSKSIYLYYGNPAVISTESDSAIMTIPGSGLVGWWTFNEGSGTTAADSSGSNNTGNLNNSPTWTTGRQGGGALNFDGSTNYVSLPACLKTGLTKFSIGLWVNTTENRTNATYWNRPTLIGEASNGNSSGDFGITTNGGYIGMWSGLNSGGDNSYLSTTCLVNNGAWHHIVAVNNGTTITLYVDTVLQGTISSGLSLDSGRFFVGTCNAMETATYFHQGSIDDVTIYNRALSTAEISALYSPVDVSAVSVTPSTAEQATTSPTLGAGWPYRKSVALNNSGSPVTNGVLTITLDASHTAFWSHVVSDGNDIRLINSDNTTKLSYNLAAFNYSGQSATMYVKVPNISAGSSTIYLYYGNAACASASSSNNMTIPMNGMVGCWRMDEGTGTSVVDSLGNDNTGSFAGNIGVVPQWTPGRFGSALMFSGHNDAVAIPDAANLQPVNDCTVSLWIKTAYPSGVIFGREYSTGGDDSYVIWYSAANTVSFFTQGATAILNNTFITGDTWHHVVAVKSGTTITLYKNGSQIATGAAPATINYTPVKNLFLGSDDNNNDNIGDASFYGTIDNVLFYNRALTTAEITKLYNEPTYTVPATYALNYAETANTYLIASSTYYTGNPTIQPIYGAFYNNNLSGFQEVSTKTAGTDIKYQVSKDGYNWYYFNGTHWVKADGGYTGGQVNTYTEINTNLALFMTEVGATGEFVYRAYLHSDSPGNNTPVLDSISVVLNTANTFYLQNTGATEGINIEHTNAGTNAADTSDTDRYFQYKVTLYSSGEVTPILDDIRLEYIKAILTITSPVGGEVGGWSVGSVHNITWTQDGLANAANGVKNTNVKIEYSVDDGAAWKIESASAPNSGTYAWTVDDDHTPTAKVKITSLGWPAVTTQSPASFRIVGGVTLTRPVGGERWIVTTQPGVQADQQEIKWTSAGTIPNVKIEYSRNGGTSWSPVKETEGTANDGIVANDTSFYWNVPDEATIADTCKIRISDSTDPNTVSTLATPFRIIGRLNITYPTVGVDLVTLQTYNVTWTTQGTVSIPRVNLSYSIDGGINWRDMAGVPNQVTNIANTNTYAWNVPNPLTTNTVIKVADPNDATVFNISPVFNVRGFQINSPNGAEEWEFNSTHNVTWTATGTITPPYTYIPFCGRRHDLDILAETVQLRSGAQYFVDVEHKRYR